MFFLVAEALLLQKYSSVTVQQVPVDEIGEASLGLLVLGSKQ